jgi:hypothetical protein
MDQTEIEAKARDLMSAVLGRQRTQALIGAIRGLSEVKTMGRLRPLWQAATPRRTTGEVR